MTKQAKSGKHPIHTLPEDIQKSLESFWEPITSASYCGNFVTTDGGRVICVPTFVVNKTRYVYVIDALDGLYTYEDITSRQERQREFGKSVNRLMEEYYCQYKNVQFGQNIFVQNCTFLFSSFCTILFYLIKILMPYLLNLLFYTNYL